MKRIVLDTEGTSLKNARVIEVAVVDADNPSISFITRCDPGVPISLESMAIHNIIQSKIDGEPEFLDTPVFRYLLKVNDPENIIIGHNIEFDIGALANEGFKSKMKVIDTYKCMHRHYFNEPLSNYKLNFLRYYLVYQVKSSEMIDIVDNYISQLPENSLHSAVFDTYLSLGIYNYLKTKYTDEEMIQISSEPVLFRTIIFGKYKDKTFEEVYLLDRQYMEWMFKEENKKTAANTEDEKKANNYLMTLTYWLSK